MYLSKQNIGIIRDYRKYISQDQLNNLIIWSKTNLISRNLLYILLEELFFISNRKEYIKEINKYIDSFKLD